MPAKESFVHQDATVIVGNDEHVGAVVIFVVKKTGAKVFSFPMEFGSSKELSAADMELFLASAPESEMVKAIREEWRKVQPQ